MRRRRLRSKRSGACGGEKSAKGSAVSRLQLAHTTHQNDTTEMVHVQLMFTQLMSFVDEWVLDSGAQRDGAPQQIADYRRISARG